MFSQLLLVSLLVAIGITDANAAQLSYGNCEVKGSKEHGSCIHIKDCPFLYEILKIQTPTEEQRQLLSDSQCGLDNTRQTTLVQRILVCCSDSNRKAQDTAAETPIANRSGDETQPGNVLPSIGTCGIMFANRIVGGFKTQIFEFPWMVLIQYSKSSNVMGFLCGGTLINSRYILTAGHCVNSTKIIKGGWNVHGVRLGEWDTTTAPDCVTELSNKKRTCAPMHIDIEVEEKIMHELYVPNSIDQRHDIALLRLKQTVSYTEYVKPICLPVAEDVRNKNYEGYAMDVAGWGFTETSMPSTVKLKTTVDVWNLEKCQQKYRSYQLHINGSQLCAGGKLNVDTCQGDSGGPLMVPSNVGNQEVFFVAGIVSYGPEPCGLQGWPGVYTRVGNYIDWVESKLKA